MGWKHLIAGSNELHSVAKSYANIFYAIAAFFKPTPPTNIIANKTILTQYNSKKGLNIFGNRESIQYKKNYSSFMIAGLSNLRNPKTSVINIKKLFWCIWCFWSLKVIRSQLKGEDAYTGGNSRIGYLREICRHQLCPPRVSCYCVWLTQRKPGRYQPPKFQENFCRKTMTSEIYTSNCKGLWLPYSIILIHNFINNYLHR